MGLIERSDVSLSSINFLFKFPLETDSTNRDGGSPLEYRGVGSDDSDGGGVGGCTIAGVDFRVCTSLPLHSPNEQGTHQPNGNMTYNESLPLAWSFPSSGCSRRSINSGEAEAVQLSNVDPMDGTEGRGGRDVLGPFGDGRSCPCTASPRRSIKSGLFGQLYKFSSVTSYVFDKIKRTSNRFGCQYQY